MGCGASSPAGSHGAGNAGASKVAPAPTSAQGGAVLTSTSARLPSNGGAGAAGGGGGSIGSGGAGSRDGTPGAGGEVSVVDLDDGAAGGGGGPASGGSPSRRLSMTGAGNPSKVVTKSQDARRRRLSMATTTNAHAKDVVRSNLIEGHDPRAPISGPVEGQHAVALPVLWGQYSRPGNDPMKRTKENQDSFAVIDEFGDEEGQMFFSVCDGHGPNGAYASQFVVRHLPDSWLTDELRSDPFVAITHGCLGVNHQLSVSDIDVYVSGCTSISLFLRGNKLYIANVGDSRAVLGRVNQHGVVRAIDLSKDQKPDRPDEMARIIASGGRVFEWGVPRVWLRDVDMPGLAMSRSFGDLAAETVGVYAEPELAEMTLTPADKFFVLASDGIWEFISSQECIDIITEYLEEGPQVACEALVAESVRRWNEEEDVVDDITCIIAVLSYD